MSDESARDGRGAAASVEGTGSAGADHEPSPRSECASLTVRERTVLGLLARGLRNQEISHELGITERTVKYHVSGLLSKLAAGNRTQAVLIAMKQGLIDS